MSFIKFDTEYINSEYIVSIREPYKNGTDDWRIDINTAHNKYPFYYWSFSSQYEAEREYNKLISLITEGAPRC